MIKIRIGASERFFGEDGVEQWIAQQIRLRRNDDVHTAVEVYIEHDDINMRLSTPGSSRGGGGGRSFRPKEKEIYEIWLQKELNTEGFSPGNLISFLNQIKSFV